MDLTELLPHNLEIETNPNAVLKKPNRVRIFYTYFELKSNCLKFSSGNDVFLKNYLYLQLSFDNYKFGKHLSPTKSDCLPGVNFKFIYLDPMATKGLHILSAGSVNYFGKIGIYPPPPPNYLIVS
jgi:hypothetical protein